jgi:hypothetical protein
MPHLNQEQHTRDRIIGEIKYPLLSARGSLSRSQQRLKMSHEEIILEYAILIIHEDHISVLPNPFRLILLCFTFHRSADIVLDQRNHHLLLLRIDEKD